MRAHGIEALGPSDALAGHLTGSPTACTKDSSRHVELLDEHPPPLTPQTPRRQGRPDPALVSPEPVPEPDAAAAPPLPAHPRSQHQQLSSTAACKALTGPRAFAGEPGAGGGEQMMSLASLREAKEQGRKFKDALPFVNKPPAHYKHLEPMDRRHLPTAAGTTQRIARVVREAMELGKARPPSFLISHLFTDLFSPPGFSVQTPGWVSREHVPLRTVAMTWQPYAPKASLCCACDVCSCRCHLNGNRRNRNPFLQRALLARRRGRRRRRQGGEG